MGAPFCAALLGCLLLTSCNRRTVAVYDIPKPEGGGAGVAPGPLSPSTERPRTWPPPYRWAATPTTELRQGSFQADGPNGASADVSVVSFPGEAGGLASNLNRWRGQVELTPLPADDLRREAQPVTAGGVDGIQVDYTAPAASAKPSRILGAVFQLPDRAWFVKMTGPPAFVESQRQTFRDFVQSFRFTLPPAQEETAAAANRPKSTND